MSWKGPLILLILAFFLFFSFLRNDMAAAQLWSSTFGGEGWDYAYALSPFGSSGYVVAGDTDSFGEGNTDVFVLRLGEDGTLLWQNTFGGPGFDEEPWGLLTTQDGGVVVAAKTDSFGNGGQDLWLLKLDGSNGTLEWQAPFGGAGTEGGYGVDVGLDGGVIVVGDTTSYGNGGFDVWIIKLDDQGVVQWQRTYGSASNEFGFSISTGSDGYYVAGAVGGGHPYVQGDYDVLALKVDQSGNVVWSKRLGGQENEYAYVVKALDNGCIVAGTNYSYGAGGGDAWVIRLDASGNILWQKTYGDLGLDEVRGVLPVQGGYLLAGVTDSFGNGLRDAWVFRIDQNGNVIWGKTYGDLLNDMANSIVAATDGTYVVAGGTNSLGEGLFDAWVFTLDTEGTSPGSIGMAPSPITPLSPHILPQDLNLVPMESTTVPVVTPSQNATVPEGEGQTQIVVLSLNIEDLNCNSPEAAGGINISGPNGQNICSHSVQGCTFSYELGENITLSAQASPGYAFAGWEGGGIDCGENTTCTISMSSNTTLTARFMFMVPSPPEGGVYLDLPLSENATCFSPMGIGLAARGQPYIDWDIMLPGFPVPMDVYLGVALPDLFPGTLFLVTSSGIEEWNGTLKPWREGVEAGVHERPFGMQFVQGHPEIPGIEVPSGNYDLYLLLMPHGSGDLSMGYYLLHSHVDIP